VLGIRGLLPLAKLSKLLRTNNSLSDSNIEELPATIYLNDDKYFHSLFSCPVLRVQSTKSNPPMMLQCGHAICKEALNRLSKGNTFMYLQLFLFLGNSNVLIALPNVR
jgi:hypothetical protein